MRAKLSRWLPWAAALVLVAVAGYLLFEREAPRSIVLISIDTLRTDHLGCYGYHRDTSPAIDAFRRDAVLFRDAVAHAPSTLPSHASMLSSLLPQHHGASMARGTPLPEAVVTLTEVLQTAGYRTVAFHGGGQVSPDFGLIQGFEIYDHVPGDFDQVVDRARHWLDGRDNRDRDQPFFLFLHTYEVHHPYRPRPDLLRLFEPEEYSGPLPEVIDKDLLRRIDRRQLEISARDRDYLVSAYDAGIRSMDEALARLLLHLEGSGLYRPALIVLTSDHGEELFDHGRLMHSHSLFDELLRVPLIVKLPGMRYRGASVDSQVRLIDLAPTVLETVGLPVPAEFTGVSLLPAIAGSREAPRPAVSAVDNRTGDHASIRHRGWKWFPGHLYHLETDPGEQQNLVDREPAVAAQLEVRLAQIVADGSHYSSAQVELEEQTVKALRALGYID